METTKKLRSAGSIAFKTALCVILALYALSLFITLGWGLFASLKDKFEFRDNLLWPPRGAPWTWEWGNYTRAFRNFFVKVEHGAGFRIVYLGRMFWYTILYAGGCAFASTATCCIAAYLVVKFPYKFSKLVYAVVIVAMILPIVGSLPSEIQMAHALGLYDRVWGMWIMKANFLGMYFLVFYGVFKSVPKEFGDAARVDGAGNTSVLLKVMLPMVRNTFFTVALLVFIGYWNDYQIPLIYLPSYPTVAYGLYLFNFSSVNSLSSVPMRLTGCLIMLLPILLVFLVFHNRLIGNVTIGGLKE